MPINKSHYSNKTILSVTATKHRIRQGSACLEACDVDGCCGGTGPHGSVYKSSFITRC